MEENSNFEHSLDERLLIMLVVILVLACVVGTLGNIIILTVVRIYKPLKMAERVFIFNLAVSDLYVTVIADPLSIVVVGTWGNLFLLLVISTTKQIWTSEAVLVMNLVLSDLYVTAVADPLGIIAKIHGAEFFDRMPGLCQTVASLCTISCVSSLMTIALMSVNRYFYICQHEKYRIIFTYRNVIFMCLSLYLVGTFLVLLNLAGIGDHSFDHKSYECIWDRMATFPYTVVFSVTLVWIPTLITGTCYLRIYLYVSAHRRKIRQQHDANDVQKATPTLRKLNLAKTLFTIYAVFTTCWIPYALLIVIDSKDEFPHEVHIYITMFAHLHPSLNWIIYYVTNKKFADAYKQLFHTAFGGSCYHTRANTQSSDRALDARKDTSKEMTETTTRLQRQELKLEDSNSSNSHSKPRQPKEDKESHI